MYKLAADLIVNHGLSRGARFMLGTISGLFGIAMIGMTPVFEQPDGLYVFGAFCLLIASACVLAGKARQFVGSCIGSSVFLIASWYLVSEITTGPVDSGSDARPSISNAVVFLVCFGLPSIGYVWKARFGLGRPKAAEDGQKP